MKYDTEEEEEEAGTESNTEVEDSECASEERLNKRQTGTSQDQVLVLMLPLLYHELRDEHQ
ncbi:hypothetical protein BM1_00721 [Bipolaris maydis]|nr:hypothetical protein BM1_00721 [Bipolaris maydis]